MGQVRGVLGGCVLLAMMLTAAGCATPLAGEQMPGENVVYVRGGTQGDVQASVEQVITTAQSVMTKMQMDIAEPVHEDTEVGRSTRLSARSASGRRVYVTASPREEGTTQLRVRIDSFGDQQLSNELYRRIARRLEDAG